MTYEGHIRVRFMNIRKRHSRNSAVVGFLPGIDGNSGTGRGGLCFGAPSTSSSSSSKPPSVEVAEAGLEPVAAEAEEEERRVTSVEGEDSSSSPSPGR